MSATDPAVTAAAEAIHVTAFQALGDAAEAVVAAVRPIIEAEVRERIAARIRAYGEATHPDHDPRTPCIRCDIHAAYNNAARIVRGK